MLLRSFRHRILSSLTAAWFGVFSVVPAELRPCPMHVGGQEHAVTPESPTGDHASMAHAAMDGGAESMAMDDMAMSDDASTPSASEAMPCHGGSSHDPKTPSAPHRCDCVTGCCASPAAALPAPSASLVLTLREYAHMAPLAPVVVVARVTAVRLPFAIGPPTRD